MASRAVELVAEIIERIQSEMDVALEPVGANYVGEVAKRWRYVDGSGEIGILEVRALEIRARQLGVGQLGSRQIELAQIGSRQILAHLYTLLDRCSSRLIHH